MAIDGEYEPSPCDWVANQVEVYERTGGEEGGTHEGQPVVILTTKGRRSGRIRKSALMRVEHDGRYAVVASMGGAPNHPVWYLSLLADPNVTLQDGARVMTMRARTANAAERQEWWGYATASWPAYDEYQTRTEREIPVVLFDPVS